MILISRTEAEFMRENGFGNMINVSSKTHKSKHRRYYLAENPRALEKLEKYRQDVIVK